MVGPLIVRLSPFFLFANLTVNPNDWKYGPEVIYDVGIEAKGPAFHETISRKNDSVDIDTLLEYNTTMKLKCRPNSRDGIICYFDDLRIVISSIDENGASKVLNDSKVDSDKYSSNPNVFFEYFIDATDYEEDRTIVSSACVRQEIIDLAKGFIDTMRVRKLIIDVRDGSSQMFNWEHSADGEMFPTMYKIAKFNEQLVTNDKNKPYDLFIKESETSISNVKGIYIFRERYRTDHKINMALTLQPGYDFVRTRWTMEMSMTKYDLKSSTVTRIDVRSPHDSEKKFSLNEKITVRLDDIVPASSPLPIIREPYYFSKPINQGFLSYSAKRLLFLKKQVCCETTNGPCDP